MITDIILLLFLLSLIGGILLFVSYASSTSKNTSTTGSAASKSSSAAGTNAASGSSTGVTKLGGGTASFDWDKNEFRLKTNLRPVTQEELLENADRHGRDGGRFVTQHAESFRFGQKYPSSSS
ncbi:uncharacterized protein MEPE_04563 [Melanopsichium pennsylvanicum]|uniref:Uncharacterized protein n=2 Tax=Melanopsichium pennsylvanicum TaxID=63383 RepID=A0AAJ4XMZ0_9BASI|nr:uncharacterized protein BN887_01017 [Melanopsichium pennsylvanicum 4]SNX85854.1 uncharacterized protein MEPE_04563 [Melanopsichium pennsylvanicum]